MQLIKQNKKRMKHGIPNKRKNKKIHYHFANRRKQVTVSRLRIGHSKLTHQQIIAKITPEECATCNKLITVHHILKNTQNKTPNESDTLTKNFQRNLRILYNSTTRKN